MPNKSAHHLFCGLWLLYYLRIVKMSIRVMKNLHILFIALFIAIMGFVFSPVDCGGDASDSCATKYNVEQGSISSSSIPNIQDGEVANGISFPVQLSLRNNSTNSLRLRNTSSPILISGKLYHRNSTRVGDSYSKQYELSSPFFCTPPCEYYIFALRRLII